MGEPLPVLRLPLFTYQFMLVYWPGVVKVIVSLELLVDRAIVPMSRSSSSKSAKSIVIVADPVG